MIDSVDLNDYSSNYKGPTIYRYVMLLTEQPAWKFMDSSNGGTEDHVNQ